MCSFMKSRAFTLLQIFTTYYIFQFTYIQVCVRVVVCSIYGVADHSRSPGVRWMENHVTSWLAQLSSDRQWSRGNSDTDLVLK